MTLSAAELPAIGSRVVLGGKLQATVRYVGTVDGQEGTWVGIEYDEPSRGKHDGSHDGRRYFECVGGQSAGSFVRLNKFLEAANFGRSLLEAAQERYSSKPGRAGSSGSPGGKGDAQQLFVPTASNRRVAVELLAPGAGSRRTSGAAGVALAVLVQQAISSVGNAAELRAQLPSLTELDLSENLIGSWSFVAELAEALPTLRTLNLSGNRLALPTLVPPAAPLSLAPPVADVASLARLQVLVLNGCTASWQEAVAVARQLPALRELHLCGNGLTSLRLPPAALAEVATDSSDSSSLSGASSSSPNDGNSPTGSPNGGGSSSSRVATLSLLARAFQKLEVLDLEDNALSSWDDVALLRTLPVLRSLLLSGNRLSDVRYSGGFSRLQSLLLGNNQLARWAAIDQLDAFPALVEARLSGNPITAAAPGAARYQCIARVGRLKVLNASVVGAAERWDAEVSYLRQVTDELAEAPGGTADEATRARILAAHPRFEALTKRYGELAPTASSKAATGRALVNSMADLTIVHGTKSLQKKLPVSLTVGKLKLMLERLLRVKKSEQALLLVPPPGSDAQPEDITDADSRELRYFEACDGCRLEVGVADPRSRSAALAAAKQAARKAHAERMAEQERTIQQFRAVEQRLMA